MSLGGCSASSAAWPALFRGYKATVGWPSLCDFLSLPVPDQPYSHTNTTQEFQQATQR